MRDSLVPILGMVEGKGSVHDGLCGNKFRSILVMKVLVMKVDRSS